MSLIKEIRELDGLVVAKAILGFLAIVAPGFLAIYHFHPELVEKYDILELVIFSSSLTLPVFAAFYALSILAVPGGGVPELRIAASWSACGSIFVLYFALLLAYLHNLGFRDLIKVVAATSIPISIGTFMFFRKYGSRSNHSPEPTGKPAAH